MAKTELNKPMAKLPRREREKLQRRNSIIDAAEKRFLESGFDRVSMDDIALDLELSKPALYRYFKNKESLYYAVVLRGMVILRDTIKKAVEKEKTGREKVLGFIRSFCFDYSRMHSDYYRLLNVAREQRFLDMFLRHEIEEAHEFGLMALELLTFLMDAIKLGIKDGTIRQDLDPLQTAIFLAVTVEATINLTPVYENLVAQKNINKDEYLERSIDLMLHGIASDKSKK
jgi:AcrR family transcriptional regulator